MSSRANVPIRLSSRAHAWWIFAIRSKLFYTYIDEICLPGCYCLFMRCSANRSGGCPSGIRSCDKVVLCGG